MVYGVGGGGIFVTKFYFTEIQGLVRYSSKYTEIYCLQHKGTCPMRKTLVRSFSLKHFSDHFYGQSPIKTVRGPLNIHGYYWKTIRNDRQITEINNGYTFKTTHITAARCP